VQKRKGDKQKSRGERKGNQFAGGGGGGGGCCKRDDFEYTHIGDEIKMGGRKGSVEQIVPRRTKSAGRERRAAEGKNKRGCVYFGNYDHEVHSGEVSKTEEIKKRYPSFTQRNIQPSPSGGGRVISVKL